MRCSYERSPLSDFPSIVSLTNASANREWGFFVKKIKKRHPVIREILVNCIKKDHNEGEPSSWGCTASLAAAKRRFKHCPLVTFLRDSVNFLHFPAISFVVYEGQLVTILSLFKTEDFVIERHGSIYHRHVSVVVQSTEKRPMDKDIQKFGF